MKIVSQSAALESLVFPVAIEPHGGEPQDVMIEFGDATFRIVCDRGVSHEIVRHRIASYAQESTRFCNYGGERFGREITVIEPSWSDDEAGRFARVHWERACLEAESAYMKMIDEGVKPQIARSVLPTCLKTEIVMKANFREWLHFLKLRTAPAAHPQMQEIARLIQGQLRVACPEVFGA